ncbi:MAG: protein kinase [Sandaracinaceae bacterium]|nr:protein kinase [Sandaracinaceae bacterium]
MGTFDGARYTIGRRVTDGPIATLHEGRLDGGAGFSRPVAIRVLAPRYAKDARFVGTFAAVATGIAARPSPHLEEPIDLVLDGDRVLYVAEWIDGLSLEHFVATYEHAPWTLVTRALVGLCDGLHRLHTIEPPYVHRGVGARAVRLSIDGAVKITRAGVAAALAATGEGRADAVEAGLWHAAPELLEGRGATPATDVFGVGALAFAALAGVPAFHDDALAEPRDLGALRKDLPSLLVSLVERALRPEPGDRFESADEMARALERLLHAEQTPVDAAALGRAVRAARGRAPRFAKTGPGPAALAATVARMAGAEPTSAKRPVGLPSERTMHVAESELTRLESVRPIPDDAPGGETDETIEATAPPPLPGRGLADDESIALPLVLGRRKPAGLAPAKTEFLDAGEVDRLTVTEPRRPVGLGAAKTEFLDEGEVDRLTVEPPSPPALRRPMGLSTAKTEFLDESEVARLRLDEPEDDDEEE